VSGPPPAPIVAESKRASNLQWLEAAQTDCEPTPAGLVGPAAAPEAPKLRRCLYLSLACR
jgi:hypothetical protein